MANGFEVFASNGALLINNNFICWFCRRTGRGTTHSPVGVGNTVPSLATIDVSGYTQPMVAIRMDSDWTIARCGNAWNSGNIRYATNAPIGTGYTYWVFDYAANIPRVYNGLECYTDSGTVSFNTGFWPFKPVFDARNGTQTVAGSYLALCGPAPGGYRNPPENVTFYDQTGIVPEGEPFTRYTYKNDCKLTGAYLPNGDTAIPWWVSFDDVTASVNSSVYTPPRTWYIPAPCFAVNVANIPLNTTFF